MISSRFKCLKSKTKVCQPEKETNYDEAILC